MGSLFCFWFLLLALWLRLLVLVLVSVLLHVHCAVFGSVAEAFMKPGPCAYLVTCPVLRAVAFAVSETCSVLFLRFQHVIVTLSGDVGFYRCGKHERHGDKSRDYCHKQHFLEVHFLSSPPFDFADRIMACVWFRCWL